MKSTKKASNAGKFYPSDKTELKNLIETSYLFSFIHNVIMLHIKDIGY